jgi:amidase
VSDGVSTNDRDVHFLPAAELVARLRTGELGSEELLDHFLGRIDKQNGTINAVVALDADRARQRAREADEATARGESWGPLHGLPITIKDSFETEGLVTTSGAPELAHHVPAEDAAAVARLKTAGGVVFGKTNLPLYAGDHQTYNKVYGRTNNPWDTDRGAGGSSGGAAAALAAGLTGLELGSDIGGSIRNPAHYCGVFGHKPTWGLVDMRGHIPGPPGSRSTADVGVGGPMGRSVADLALALDVLAGPSGLDAAGWRVDLPAPRNGGELAGLRVATWFDDPESPISQDSRVALEAVAAALDEAGAHVAPATPPASLGELVELWEWLVLPLMTGGLPDVAVDQLAAGLPPRPGDSAEAAAEGSTVRALRAVTARHRDWLRASERRHKLRHAFAAFFDDHDVLLAPVTPVPAFPHDTETEMLERTLAVDGDERRYTEGISWAAGIGILYLPVTVPPIGRTPAGLPVGIQVVAPHLHDRTALAAAAHIERLLGGFVPPPGF